ncbi:hypothetical protein OHA09_33055 [Streptomyces longwoodensis]|uniref:DUF6895 family protein n=1 Tax=Streptomyces longwoodensis TaxID=68231 RepID=UPI002E805F01|nr:hypothetical protein [Streptomyces longwoodensis]WUC62688.1 hypothetical protein OHA09_33055 [Streptomyces longwoodensis]
MRQNAAPGVQETAPADVRHTVRAVQGAALGWLSRNRAHFALGDDALARDGRVDGSWKPLGELAQVCATLSVRTPPSDPLHACVRDLLAFAWRQTGEGALFCEVQRAEPFATYPLEVYAAFASAGLRHPGYERAAATVAATRGWRLTEQLPTRRLGVLCAERQIGLRRDDDEPALLARTWLGGLPEPWTFERASGYALTHVVFHLTDWGRGGPNLPPAVAEHLAHWAPAWLVTCLEGGLWDLACEVAAVAAGVPAAGTDATFEAELAGAWARIAGVQYASGALPEEDGRVAAEVPHEETVPPRDGASACGASGFRLCYHSTLMAAFAAGLTLARWDDAGVPRAYGGRRDAPVKTPTTPTTGGTG